MDKITTETEPTGVEKMDNVREVVAGDHEGLNDLVEKSEDTIVEAVADDESKTVDEVVKTEDVAPAVEEPAQEDPIAAVDVEESVDAVAENVSKDEPVEDPMAVMAANMAALIGAVTGLTEGLSKQQEQIEVLTKSQAEVVEKAGTTTQVVDWGISESLATPNREGRIAVGKSDQPIGQFDNLFAGINQ